MAKYIGTSGKRVGSVGNETYAQRLGTGVVKAKATEVHNPKTSKQVAQRSIFLDAVGFYKQAQANFFKFAFEDKKSNETDYNAYMRHNAKLGIRIDSELYNNKLFPCIGDFYLSMGSLPNPTVKVDGADCYLSGLSGISSTTTTVGALSSLLVSNYGLQNGDIVTMVGIDSCVQGISIGASTGLPAFTTLDDEFQPKWTIKQIIVNTSSNVTLASLGITVAQSTNSILYFSGNDQEEIIMAAVVFSRQTTSGLLTSNSQIVGNDVFEAAKTTAATEDWFTAIKKYWGSSEAILQGSLA